MRFRIPDLRTYTSSLNATDKLLASFWGFLACLSVAFSFRLPHWLSLITANLAAIVLISLIAYAARASGLRWVRGIHDWSAFPLVLFSYKILYYVISPFHGGKDFDRLLIVADRWLLGNDPATVLARIATPYLTELLQIAYALFYLYFIVVGLELYRKPAKRMFRYFRFTVVYGFILSYIGYFFLPAVGPRFTLYEFSKIGTDLPGVLFTPALRRFVDFFESIPPDVPDFIAQAAAQRDVFPSAHTMLTLIVIVLAYRYRLRVRRPLLVAGLLLIFATVYLRYHYMIDIIVGALLALFCLTTLDNVYARFGGGDEDPKE